MSGTEREERDTGSFSIDIDDDLLAAALGAVEKRSHAPTPQPPPLERDAEAGGARPPMLQEEESNGLDEDFEIEFDMPDFESEAAAVNESLTQQELEVQALSERVVDLQDELAEVREDRDRQANRATGLVRDRRRTAAHVRMVEERMTRMEQHRQSLMDERDAALQRLQEMERERTHLLEDAARHRDRQRREQLAQRRSGAAPVLLELLPAVDNLELALGHAGANHERVIQGLEMILAQLHLGLQRGGVERIHAAEGGAFDPEVHEAVLEEPAEGIAPGRISRVVSAGYRLHGRLLRPAKVAVSGASSPAQETWSLVQAEGQQARPPDETAASDEVAAAPPIDDRKTRESLDSPKDTEHEEGGGMPRPVTSEGSASSTEAASANDPSEG